MLRVSIYPHNLTIPWETFRKGSQCELRFNFKTIAIRGFSNKDILDAFLDVAAFPFMTSTLFSLAQAAETIASLRILRNYRASLLQPTKILIIYSSLLFFLGSVRGYLFYAFVKVAYKIF